MNIFNNIISKQFNLIKPTANFSEIVSCIGIYNNCGNSITTDLQIKSIYIVEFMYYSHMRPRYVCELISNKLFELLNDMNEKIKEINK